jgi:flagellar FliJ protein
VSGSPYRFRLERVRALRERREDEAKMELATALADQRAAAHQLGLTAEQIELARRSQHRVGSSSAAELLSRQAYLERLESTQRLNLEELQLRENAVTGSRTALTHAAQERQALERLKAKGAAAHRRELDRVESVTLDEIATNGYRRRAAA